MVDEPPFILPDVASNAHRRGNPPSAAARRSTTPKMQELQRQAEDARKVAPSRGDGAALRDSTAAARDFAGAAERTDAAAAQPMERSRYEGVEISSKGAVHRSDEISARQPQRLDLGWKSDASRLIVE
jgi:hypothetical protein